MQLGTVSCLWLPQLQLSWRSVQSAATSLGSNMGQLPEGAAVGEAWSGGNNNLYVVCEGSRQTQGEGGGQAVPLC